MKLKLSEMASIAEVVGAVAVVISLLYVGVQVQDSARAVRSAAVNDANSSIQAWYLNISNNRQMSELWLDGLLSEQTLETDDEFQFMMTVHGIFLGFQNSFLLAQEGSLDERVLKSIMAALLPVKDLPGLQRFWRQRSGYFYPDFALYVDAILTGDESSDAVDVYRNAVLARSPSGDSASNNPK